jgi:hypothetical protein
LAQLLKGLIEENLGVFVHTTHSRS